MGKLVIKTKYYTMNIAINGIDFIKHSPFTEYKLWLISSLALQMPSHQFFIFSTYELNLKITDNVSIILLKPINNKGISKLFWQKIQLPSLIKKYKIDKILSFDNPFFYHKKTQNYLLTTAPISSKNFNLSNFEKIGFLSRFASLNIENFSNSSLVSVFAGIVMPQYRSLHLEKKEQNINAIADEKEYFSFTNWTDDEQEIITLLKAFSIFKKKQTSTWKLVMILHNPQIKSKIIEVVKNYKYKNDLVIKLAENHQIIAEIIAASYCFITTSQSQTDIIMHQAFNTGVPVIALDEQNLHEIYHQAYIAFYPMSIEAIADKIIYIYKDENLGNSYIGKSLEEAQNHDSEKIIKQLSYWLQ